LSREPKCKVVAETADCTTFLWKHEEPIEIYVPIVSEITPIEIHVKPDGALDGKPSLCVVMDTGSGFCVYAQLTLETIWPAIEAAIKCKGELS
jgi:hypothetical protein